MLADDSKPKKEIQRLQASGLLKAIETEAFERFWASAEFPNNNE